tara:strand:+ start:74 stop:952 length:879 start_codon:yes stop_codon:yes gene_type:complete
MNILITGGSGFIGQRLVKELSKNNIIWLVSRKTKTSINKKVLNYDDVLGFNKKDFTQIPHIDVVIHLATHFVSKHSDDDVSKIIESNILLGVRLLEICNYFGYKKIINASSFAQSLDGISSFPQNLYAASKESFSVFLNYYSKSLDFNIINLEFFDCYGSNDNRKKIFNLALEAFTKNKLFNMSKGEQEICLIHINDLIQAVKKAVSLLEENKGLSNYTLLNNGNKYILKELVFKLKKILKSKSEIKLGFYPYRKNEIMVLKTRYSKLPGWKSKTDLKEAVKKIIKNDYNRK